ncbi:MAG TPA: cyclic nucleotide-binding domain-containing protein [Deltaproteobacteria bacterium]|nr:cyclic nucleotide-binding domain-containing protein [Deltaproteobacteria bacterium]
MASELRAILADIELLQSLDDEARSRIAEVGRVEHWQDGAVVLEEGAFGPRMMVILQGRVAILRRDSGGVQRVITSLGEGDVLGEMSLLLDLPRTASVHAVGALQVFAIDRSAFWNLIEADDPVFLRLGFELSRVLARRLMALNQQVIELLAEDEGLRRRFGDARQELFELWDPALDQGKG